MGKGSPRLPPSLGWLQRARALPVTRVCAPGTSACRLHALCSPGDRRPVCPTQPRSSPMPIHGWHTPHSQKKVGGAL